MAKDHERLKIDDHVTVETHTASGRFPIHWHSYFEIEIVTAGRGKYVVNDVVYDISEKNVFFLTPTDFHYLDIDGEATMINVSFDEEGIGERELMELLFNKLEKAYRFENGDYDRLVASVELLRYECGIDGDCRDRLLQYVIKSILRKNSYTAEGVREEGARGIKKAIIYMELHFKERITLSDLAEEAGYHPTYFSELFKKTTGETYIETLNKLRVGCARSMLANGFSVSDSCFLSGFGSISGFSAAFRKFSGMSPREYKKRLCGEKR